MTQKNTPPPLIFTDLDGTLLDHFTYSAAAALPTLQRLNAGGVPVIPTSSKTLAEISVIQHDLGLEHPAVGENGAVIYVPPGYFADIAEANEGPTDVITMSAWNYSRLRAFLQRLRQKEGYRFEGFSDWDDAQVSGHTGLDLAAASRARDRKATEPILWQDDSRRLGHFREQLKQNHLRLLRGGRFWHVMGEADKATAMEWLVAKYSLRFGGRPRVVAVGESPNDLAMLRHADTAIVVRAANGTHLTCDDCAQVITTEGTGPVGWREGIEQTLGAWLENG